MFYSSAPHVMFDCLRIDLLLHDTKKDLVANSGSCALFSMFIELLQLVA